MRVQLFTFRYSATLGGFDDEPLRQFIRDKEVIALREHFSCVNEVPHLACVLIWQQSVVARSMPDAQECRAATARGRPRPDHARPDPLECLDEAGRITFQRLREWRARQAHAEGVPPYLLFTNRQLGELIQKRPESLTALGLIEGVGPSKVERYGAEVLALLAPSEEPAAVTGSTSGEATP